MQVWNSHDGLPLSSNKWKQSPSANVIKLMQMFLCADGIILRLCCCNNRYQQWWVSSSLFFCPRPCLLLSHSLCLTSQCVWPHKIFFWLQDDRSVGGSSHVHGSRIWQPSGRNGPGLCLPTAQPPEPGAPSISSDRKPGVWEIWEHHCTTGRFEPGRLQW